ncbi:MAG TPA: hypothetical protein VM841_02310 [Actinomycetota bacterium]|nr:hypothetical protein [Actinomycetota bacterium]
MRRVSLVLMSLTSLAASLLPSSATATPGSHPGFLFNAQDNRLDVYDLSAAHPALARSTPIHAHDHDPDAGPGEDPVGRGNDVNGQICRVVQADGSVRFVMGEDSDQESLPAGIAQGWGLFEPSDGAEGPWTMTGKIVAPFRVHDNDHQPETTGCAVSADGSMLFLVDLGVGAFDVPGVGSLFLYRRDAGGNFSASSPVCVLADDLTTAGYIAMHPDGSVLVPEGGRFEGGVVSRFRPPFPAAGDAAGCAAYRAAHGVADRESFLGPFAMLPFDPVSFVPISIARRGSGWLIGNVFPGQVAEYDGSGSFVRVITAGQGPGVAGIAVDGHGNVYIANLGLVPCETLLCPASGAGTLWKVAFDPLTDAPLPPVLVMAGLTYPEGIAVFPSL